MDQTARWMKTGGEGIPPAEGAENGNFLGLSPRAAALAVMVLLGVVMAGVVFQRICDETASRSCGGALSP